MNLPIDVIPNSNPPRFRWTQLMDTAVGRRLVDLEGTLPPNVEGAVVALIRMARTQAEEIEQLRGQVKGHCERIAAQSELLSKRTEVPKEQITVAPSGVSSIKKK